MVFSSSRHLVSPASCFGYLNCLQKQWHQECTLPNWSLEHVLHSFMFFPIFRLASRFIFYSGQMLLSCRHMRQDRSFSCSVHLIVIVDGGVLVTPSRELWGSWNGLNALIRVKWFRVPSGKLPLNSQLWWLFTGVPGSFWLQTGVALVWCPQVLLLSFPTTSGWPLFETAGHWASYSKALMFLDPSCAAAGGCHSSKRSD